MGMKEELLEELGFLDSFVFDGGERKEQSLEEHDRQHHPDGYDPATDECKLRDRISTETEEDKGDELDEDRGEGRKETAEGKELKSPIVTPEEDAAYLDAVEKGDLKTAQKMLDKVAKKVFGNSVAQGKVWHSTKKKFTEFKNMSPNVHFFAKDRKWAEKFGAEERYAKPEDTKAYYIAIEKPLDMQEERTGSEWLSYFEEKGVKIGDNGREKLEKFGDNKIPGYALLNHDMAEPHGTGYRDSMVAAGYDGAVLEDVARGDADRTTYGAFASNGIKSADAVTYDDQGNVVPLSKRFDGGSDIRGDVGSGNGEKVAAESPRQTSKQITETLGKDINNMSEGQADTVINDFYQGWYTDRKWMQTQERKAKRFGAINVGKTKRFVAAAVKELSAKYPKIKDVLSHVEFLPAPYGDTKRAYTQGVCARSRNKNDTLYAMMMGWGEVGRYDYNWEKHRDLPNTVADRGANVLMSNRAVLMHEIGHIFQYTYDNNKEWDELVRSDKTGWTKHVSDYGNSARDELHSECIAFYTMPEYKKGTFPSEVEAFLDKELKG